MSPVRTQSPSKVRALAVSSPRYRRPAMPGTRIRTSPCSPAARVAPASSVIRSSKGPNGLPAALGRAGSTTVVTMAGIISVELYRFSSRAFGNSARISSRTATGSGALLNVTAHGVVSLVVSVWPERASQWPMAGTRATRSIRSRSTIAQNRAASNSGIRYSVLAQPSSLEKYIWAAALAIGNGAITRSAAAGSAFCGPSTAGAARWAWLSGTPLGRPVVPDVNSTMARSPGSAPAPAEISAVTSAEMSASAACQPAMSGRSLGRPVSTARSSQLRAMCRSSSSVAPSDTTAAAAPALSTPSSAQP